MQELADFKGAWRLERRIEDRRSAQTGRLTGCAWFAAHGDGLLYGEEGVLELGSGARFPARQSHLWHAAPPDIVVRFSDGRDFHRFDARSVAPGARHLCGTDLYLVRYDFAGWPRWRVTWTVSGPNKDYTSRSVYVAAAARSADRDADAPVARSE